MSQPDTRTEFSQEQIDFCPLAPLPLITLQTIKIPEYRNERLRSFALWYRDNEPALSEYYNALRPYCDGEPLQDFFKFAAIQHEREEMKATERLPHGTSL